MGIEVERDAELARRDFQRRVVLKVYQLRGSYRLAAMVASRFGRPVSYADAHRWVAHYERTHGSMLSHKAKIAMKVRRDATFAGEELDRQRARAIELRRQGLPYDVIAARVSSMGLNVTTDRVRTWVRRARKADRGDLGHVKGHRERVRKRDVDLAAVVGAIR